ncbi:unnamed protein product [Closterium sp. Yama58-4]|nr:unnamed protein product [Closterium sp. Yama58-4]
MQTRCCRLTTPSYKVHYTFQFHFHACLSHLSPIPFLFSSFPSLQAKLNSRICTSPLSSYWLAYSPPSTSFRPLPAVPRVLHWPCLASKESLSFIPHQFSAPTGCSSCATLALPGFKRVPLLHPPPGFGPYQLFLVCYTGLAWLADAMEMILLSFVGPAARCEFGLSAAEESLIASVVFLGVFLGSYVWGLVADAYGRRRGFMATALFTLFAGLLSAWSPTFLTLLVSRCLVGFGIGGASVVFSLCSEFLPSNSRGFWLVFIEFFWTIGSLIEAALAWAVMPSLHWRMLVLLSATPFALLLLLYPFLPESPRFLLLKGNASAAHIVLEKAARTNGKRLPPGRLVSAASGPKLLASPRPSSPSPAHATSSSPPPSITKHHSSHSSSYYPVYSSSYLLPPTPTTIFLFAARAAIMGSFAVLWAYTPEIYPTEIRSTGLGVANSWARLGGFLCPFVAVGLIEGSQRELAILLFVFIPVFAAVITACFASETKGAALGEKISSFRHTGQSRGNTSLNSPIFSQPDRVGAAHSATHSFFQVFADDSSCSDSD